MMSAVDREEDHIHDQGRGLHPGSRGGREVLRRTEKETEGEVLRPNLPQQSSRAAFRYLLTTECFGFRINDLIDHTSSYASNPARIILSLLWPDRQCINVQHSVAGERDLRIKWSAKAHPSYPRSCPSSSQSRPMCFAMMSMYLFPHLILTSLSVPSALVLTVFMQRQAIVLLFQLT